MSEIATQIKRSMILTAQPRCPICGEWWTFQWRQEIAKLSDVEGVYKTKMQGTDVMKIDVAGWGTHVLCGRDGAKRKAQVIFKKDGANHIHIPWTENDERLFRGRIKNQAEYGAMFYATKDEGGELIDQQKQEEWKILRGGIVISRERAIDMGLTSWIEGLQK